MSALNLKDIVKKVILITEEPEIKVAEPIMLERLNNSENIEVITNAKPLKIIGENKVGGILISLNGDEKEIKSDGIFVTMGHIPNSEYLKDSGIELTKRGFVKVNKNCKTNIEGIFACGDIAGGILQVSKAIGEGAVALASASRYLDKLDR
jgi:thioredoxin reductase (NADPH)